jgi:hypothetical protein
MPTDFSKLSTEEKELAYKAPLLVCILIAGADGKIDGKEMSEAIGMAQEREWVKANLKNYFAEVSEDFEDKIKMLIQAYPFDAAQRNPIIARELSGLNQLWPRVDPDFSSALYQSLRYISQRIALSSGGFLKKISSEEAQLMDLPMLLEPGK